VASACFVGLGDRKVWFVLPFRAKSKLEGIFWRDSRMSWSASAGFVVG